MISATCTPIALSFLYSWDVISSLIRMSWCMSGRRTEKQCSSSWSRSVTHTLTPSYWLPELRLSSTKRCMVSLTDQLYICITSLCNVCILTHWWLLIIVHSCKIKWQKTKQVFRKYSIMATSEIVISSPLKYSPSQSRCTVVSEALWRISGGTPFRTPLCL